LHRRRFVYASPPPHPSALGRSHGARSSLRIRGRARFNNNLPGLNVWKNKYTHINGGEGAETFATVFKRFLLRHVRVIRLSRSVSRSNCTGVGLGVVNEDKIFSIPLLQRISYPNVVIYLFIFF